MTSKIKVDNITNQSDSNIVNKCSTTITVGTGSDTTNVPGAAVVTGNVTGANVIASGNVVKTNALQASDAGNIISQSGTTITIGASGDTVSLASGASQSGFGRSGSVDWQTTAKTGDFTASDGEGYFIDTSSSAITMTLPAGSAGAIVSAQDYNNTFDSNAFTIQAAGTNKINGGSAGGKIVLNTEGEGITLVYVDDTVGWRSIEQSVFTDQSVVAQFVTATGGTITTVCTNFKVHTFTGPGTFCVSSAGNACGSNTVSYMVVGGGGGGGPGNVGGGGGAGGFREGKTPCTPYTASPLVAPAGLPVSAQGYSIAVGGGGGANADGVNSTFSSITSAGGGNGGGGGTTGGAGGSGGGGGELSGGGGSGNTPPVSPPQGQNGGSTNATRGGGGGGAGATGSTGQSSGNGGAGVSTSINASSVARSGGGGGGAYSVNFGSGGSGGSGGGAAGAPNQPTPGGTGTINTGGGGGGAGYTSGAGSAGSGGSGIVIIRYKFQ